MVLADSVDQDQTGLRGVVWSRSSLLAILNLSARGITVWWNLFAGVLE